MAIYICFAVLAFWLVALRGIGYRLRHGLYMVFFLLTLISGVRDNIGVDFGSYFQIFYLINSGEGYYRYIEPLNIVLIKFPFILSLDNWVIFFEYSIVILFGVFFFIKRLSKNKEMSVFLFVTLGIFFLSTLNEIRQWAAVSMFLVSVVFAIERKLFKSLFFSLLSIMFHLSAILPALLLPFMFKRYSFFVICMVVIFSIAMQNGVFYLVSLTQYRVYIEDLHFEHHGGGFIVVFVLCVLFLVYYFQYFNKEIVFNRTRIVMLNMAIVVISIIVVGVAHGWDFLLYMRMARYFIFFFLILLPEFVSSIYRLDYRAGFFASTMVYGFSFAYYVFVLSVKGSKYSLVPYSAISPFNF